MVLLLVAAGLAILGGIWGLVRMAATAAALAGGILAGRLAGPTLAVWAFGAASGVGYRVAASLLAGGAAFALLLLAGAGLRKLLERLHLSLVDRLLGAAVAASLSLGVSALLLAFAAGSGYTPTGRLATELTSLGQRFLAAYNPPSSNAKPSSNPAKPTRSGQHPDGP